MGQSDVGPGRPPLVLGVTGEAEGESDEHREEHDERDEQRRADGRFRVLRRDTVAHVQHEAQGPADVGIRHLRGKNKQVGTVVVSGSTEQHQSIIARRFPMKQPFLSLRKQTTELAIQPN